MMKKIEKGDRVRFNLNERGQFSAEAVRRRKEGVVVGRSTGYESCVRVKWTLLKGIDTISIRFLVKVKP